MNALKIKKSIPFKEAVNIPELADLCEAIRVFDTIPRYKRFPNKYKASVKNDISEDLILLYNSNPNVPLKEVIIYALKDLDDDLPSHLLLEMTQFALAEWQKLSVETLHENSTLQLI